MNWPGAVFYRRLGTRNLVRHFCAAWSVERWGDAGSFPLPDEKKVSSHVRAFPALVPNSLPLIRAVRRPPLSVLADRPWDVHAASRFVGGGLDAAPEAHPISV